MSATSSRQYRPPSHVIVADRACSVRTVRDLADGMNNYKRYAGVTKYRSMIWPEAGPIYSADNSAVEQLVLPPMAPVEIPWGYENALWTIRHYRTAGTGTITWKLYAHAKLYVGPKIFDAQYCYLQQVSEIVTDSTTARIESSTTPLKLVRNASNLVFALLTATNEDTGTRGVITSFELFGVP